MSCDTPREIEDDDWLSQVGKKRVDDSWKFPGAPRPLKRPPEQDVSMILGVYGPAEARIIAYGRLTTLTAGKDAVRHFRAGDLRSKGFRVDHTPRHGGSLIHVSVFWDHGDWDDTVADLLHSCCMEGVV